jgi:hypothetical protein
LTMYDVAFVLQVSVERLKEFMKEYEWYRVY